MREKCLKLDLNKFLNEQDFKDIHIWDLKYISTSDEEDNDSSESESSEEESEEESKDKAEPETKEDKDKKLVEQMMNSDSTVDTNPNNIWKEDHKADSVPQIAKKLKPAKKKQRVYYAYSYDNKPDGENTNQTGEPKKSIVVRKRVEARQPENLIDLLVM